MKHHKWEQAKALFVEALTLEQDELIEFVEQRCIDDPELKELVLDLLSGDQISQSSQQGMTHLVSEEADQIITHSFSAQKGDHFGVYQIEEMIGEGGMGAVYLGKRDDGQFEQRVAIKVIHGRNLTNDSIKRFRQERQILASLQHPNIAKLIDGGETEQGFPYIVMEYIKGINIVEYCRINKLDVTSRLALFKQVADTLVYAHQNLIIHRDIKPSNVMVDNNGSIKLLDFGIAKLIDREALVVNNDLTQYEWRMLSPVNASPEQVKNEPATTLTDVYGLGTLLYQIMTEKPLFDTKNLTSRELEDYVLDKLPTRPSENLSSTHSIKSLKLASTLSGDLDTIILKTLQKEPLRRYASVEQLSADVQRYLTNFPILAKPDSKTYILKKFVQRNKVSTAFTGVLATFLVVFMSALTYQSYVIQQERDRAVRESSNSYQISEFLKQTFQAANPYIIGDAEISPKDLLDNARERIVELEGDLLLKAQLKTTLADVYRSLADYKNADELAQSAQHIYDTVPSNNKILLAQQNALLANIAYEKGNVNDSFELLAPLISELNQMLNDRHLKGQKTQISDLLSDALISQGVNLIGLDRQQEAIVIMEKALVLTEQENNQHPRNLSSLYATLGNAYKSVFRFDDAEKYILKGIEKASQIYGERNLELAYAYNQLASVYNTQDRNDEALQMAKASYEIRRAIYKEPHQELGASLGMLSRLHTKKREYDQALDYRIQSLEVIRAVFGDAHHYVGATMLGVANLQLLMGQLAEAETITLQAQKQLLNTLPEGNINTARAPLLLGKIHYQQQRYQPSITLLTESLNISQTARPDGHWIVAEAHSFLALNHFALNNIVQAKENKEKSLQMYIDIFGEANERTISMQNKLTEIP